jgi:hypothetical protein
MATKTMPTLLKFVGGPLDGDVEVVDFAEFDLSTLTPDSHTLEIPHGFTLASAIAVNQVRLIEEKTALKSVPLKIVRYRNSGPGVWDFIKPD